MIMTFCLTILIFLLENTSHNSAFFPLPQNKKKKKLIVLGVYILQFWPFSQIQS